MAIEQYTESLTMQEMKCVLGKNDFGYVFPQGDISDVDKIERLLKKAGGKPKDCALNDYSLGGNGKAKPEYVITFNDDISTIIIIECKNSVKKHVSEKCDHPRDYAVDGVLYYSKFLKEEYNVVALAISGTKKETMRVSTFYWIKGQENYTELCKARDIILEPKNYIELIKGNKLQKAYSLDEIRNTAIDMHDYLREIKMTERHKPIFIAGILIALNDEDFAKSYVSLPSFGSVIQNIQIAIENVLKDSGIKNNRITYIKQAFKNLLDNSKFSSIPLGHKKSITWYIEELEMKIKPMMDYADNTIDALGVFYHEFIKYSGGDGNGLGIVLTPQHLTEFMCGLAGVNKNSRVVDICCGSGSFLVTAMSKMFKEANPEEAENIRKNGLYGVEFDDELYTLAIANMIIRKDGKSNIYFGDCFKKEVVKELKAKNINIGLINPPYSQTDVVELEFVEHLLEILVPGGIGVVVVPMSCAIGTKFKDVRERLFKKNTLKAVFSMPDDIFYPTGTNVCIMVWEAHTPHDSEQETFFGYCKDDGFVKRKKLGRVDAFNKWEKIEREWLSLYRNRDVKDGLSARQCVSYSDEWLCEAYMKTDYSKLTESKFQRIINNHVAHLICHQITDLKPKFEINNISITLDVEKWKEFAISDLFTVKYGINLELINCQIVEKWNEDSTVNFVARTENDNGVVGRVEIMKGYEPQQAGLITCAGGGSVLSTFVQRRNFYSGRDLYLLIPKYDMSIYAKLFCCTVIEENKYRFSYGRQANKTMPHLIIKLPVKADGIPDFKYMENYIKTFPYSNMI